MPLFGAFVRARVCGCSECGQAARTEQVGAGIDLKLYLHRFVEFDVIFFSPWLKNKLQY